MVIYHIKMVRIATGYGYYLTHLFIFDIRIHKIKID